MVALRLDGRRKILTDKGGSGGNGGGDDRHGRRGGEGDFSRRSGRRTDCPGDEGLRSTDASSIALATDRLGTTKFSRKDGKLEVKSELQASSSYAPSMCIYVYMHDGTKLRIYIP